MKSVVTALGAAVVVGLAGFASAKTIALWPIEWNEGTYDADSHCRVDPANDLTLLAGLEAVYSEAPGVGLPPNPSADVLEDFACNYSSYHSKADAAQDPHYVNEGSDGVCRWMTTTNDVTVELFFKLDTLPAVGKWAVLFGFNPESNGADRWMCTLRHVSAEAAKTKDEFYWNLYGFKRTANDVDSTIRVPAEEAEEYFSQWHHVAYVFKHDCGDGKNWSGLYVDSVLVCEASQSAVTQYPGQTHSVPDRFCIGGRQNSNRLYGSFDYIRVSDEALEPSQFLTAGSAGWHLRGGHKTVAYWPLDAKDGVIDGRNALGGSPMQMLVDSPNKTNNLDQIHVSPDLRRAIVGDYPPNRRMAPAPTLDMPETGCVRLRNTYNDKMKNTCLYDESVGADLTLTNDFTVEGWFLPERAYPASTQFLFATDAGTNTDCWYLFLNWANHAWSLKMYAFDGKTALVNNLPFAVDSEQDVNGWMGWRHVALVYEAAGGTGGVGKWTLYLDGEQAGSIENSGPVDAAYDPTPGFTLGGRWNSSNRAFCGCIDQVRACKAALTPSQFLNAAQGAVATDVLRYWPLNVINGIMVDGRDATGQGKDLSAVWETKKVPKAVAGAPIITNPDPSVAGRAPLTGGVRFCDGREATATEKRANSSLATFDRATLDLVNAKRPMTCEYYYLSYPKSDISGWNNLLAFVSGPKSSGWTFRMMFNYSDDDRKFYYQDRIYGDLKTDTLLANDTMHHDGTWHHVAIVRTVTSTGMDYKLYHDGTLKGSQSVPFVRETPQTATEFVIGGRWSTSNSIDGMLASVRVSEGALEQDQFLNATPLTPVPATSTAWFEKRAEIPFSKINVGLWTASAESFTLEAKVTLPEAVTEPVELMGASDAHSTVPADWYGWRLSLRADGTAHLEGSRGPKLGRFVSADFGGSLSGFLGRAVRLAVSYDANDGLGVWKLYANGVLVGTLENVVSPRGMYNEATGYDVLPTPVAIGRGLTGSARDIRQTRGVLAADELLREKGLIIVVD